VDDSYALQRFVDPQELVIDDVRRELQHGRKTSHWMWFIFPQIAGLGASAMSREFAIHSLDEARAYLGHPLHGARLRECTNLVIALEGRSVREIFGDDDRKFRSSMTLFARAADHEGDFAKALEKYFGGESDPATLERL
jgi:uncharacterized protein (DUF1810 family)